MAGSELRHHEYLNVRRGVRPKLGYCPDAQAGVVSRLAMCITLSEVRSPEKRHEVVLRAGEPDEHPPHPLISHARAVDQLARTQRSSLR